MRSAPASLGIILSLSLLAVPSGTTGESPDAVPADENDATEPVYVTWSGDFAGFLDVPGDPQQFPWGFRMLEGNRAVRTSDDPASAAT